MSTASSKSSWLLLWSKVLLIEAIAHFTYSTYPPCLPYHDTVEILLGRLVLSLELSYLKVEWEAVASFDSPVTWMQLSAMANRLATSLWRGCPTQEMGQCYLTNCVKAHVLRLSSWPSFFRWKSLPPNLTWNETWSLEGPTRRPARRSKARAEQTGKHASTCSAWSAGVCTYEVGANLMLHIFTHASHVAVSFRHWFGRSVNGIYIYIPYASEPLQFLGWSHKPRVKSWSPEQTRVFLYPAILKPICSWILAWKRCRSTREIPETFKTELGVDKINLRYTAFIFFVSFLCLFSLLNPTPFRSVFPTRRRTEFHLLSGPPVPLWNFKMGLPQFATIPSHFFSSFAKSLLSCKERYQISLSMQRKFQHHQLGSVCWLLWCAGLPEFLQSLLATEQVFFADLCQNTACLR